MEIEFLHEHPLKFYEKSNEEICMGCREPILDQTYGCSRCQFFLHKSCTQLPIKIKHFFHPCPLLLRISSISKCNACYEDTPGFIYSCEPCEFNMDIKCSQLPKINPNTQEKQIYHSSHRHPLTLFTDLEGNEAYCKLCKKLCLIQICGCSECNYYLHISCMEFLPQKIQGSFHSCIVTLLTVEQYLCGSCNKNFSGLTFRCGKCYFHICLDCFVTSTVKSEGHSRLPLEIQHFIHPCPLFLRISYLFMCNACLDRRSGFAYYCEKCEFNLDIECSQVPIVNSEQIQHFSHLHPLTLYGKLEDSEEISCRICDQLRSGSACGCSQCNFYLHKSCMEILPQKLEPLFHSCPLILLSTVSYRCDACHQDYSGLTFRCGKCYFHLCVNCSLMSTMNPNRPFDIPRKIQHFFHLCPLFLRITPSYTCNACYKQHSTFRYRCNDCDFNMDIECALIPTVESDSKEQIQHFCHWHPLTLFEQVKDHETCCGICGKLCLSPIYGCSQCNFYIHKSCMEALEQRIEHFFHRCPLILLTTPSYRCDGCDKGFSGLTFRCGKCYFQLCVECALLPAIESDFHTKIQHFLHRHPLILTEKKVTDKVYCYECGECCRGNTYGCIKCNFFLHKSCAKLPHEIESPFHPEHPLSLLYMSSQNSETEIRCGLCLKICSHFAFCCEKCSLVLDVECALLKPTIKYQGHDHDLTVVEKIHDELECDACYSSCKDHPAFRCMECNFDIHLLCGPLPCQIKHKCHVDPLTLKDYYVEDEDEDDEFYCDACEQRRDPRLCVYYCSQGCPMVCDVKCVMSEVVASLRGERGDVELRIVGRHMISRVFSKDLANEEIEQNETNKVAATKEKIKIVPTRSLDDIVDSLDPTEQSELNDIATAMKTKSKATLESNKNHGTLPYSEGAFTQFMDWLDSSILKYKLPNFIAEHDFTSVGDYLVSQTLIPTFQDLFAKYGDVSAKSTFSPKLKSIVFCILCSVIHSMQTTKVVDITEDILQEWWACLKFVQLAGFKIQSIIDHVKRVARAYFVLQARMFTDHTSVEKNEEIEQISRDIKVLTVKLEEIKEQQEHNKLNAQAATASLMKQFLRDASAMKWKPAAHGLL